MECPKVLSDKRNVLAIFAVSTALDALSTYVALKSFSFYLEEGNCFLAYLIDLAGLEWALVFWFGVNVAALPLLNFFWEWRLIRYFVYVVVITRFIAVINNLRLISDILVFAARLS